ncbi:molecular chaperone TorD family protein [Photobacterium minamisatsumaniensis]|uniref:molecular chaperone TorD family protein n=1 Tax=Photobacterium minamisatsumaniensis TaxID=2910233 RepID=UPI003D09D047
MITVVPRILGFLFYYSPSHPAMANILPAISDLADFFEEAQQDSIRQHIAPINIDNKSLLAHDYSTLFEGIGEMPAPPWGSVYLDPENIVMGATTLRYRQFLNQHAIALNTEMNEPDDQFGLMLLAFVEMLESEKYDAAAELLQVHLLPWGDRYLQVVQETEKLSSFYPQLAKVAQVYLADIAKLFEVTPAKSQLYR